MFNLNTSVYTDLDPRYREPLGSRLSTLLNGTLRIAYVYESPDYSTFRYRVYNMVEAINLEARRRSTAISASYFTNLDGDFLPLVADSADVLVLSRYRHSDYLERLLERARSRGAAILFDIDDLVFDVDHISSLARAIQIGDAHLSLFAGDAVRFRKTIDLCDAALVSTPVLASQLIELTGRDATVVPNFMNSAQLKISKVLFEAKQRAGFARSGPTVVGYFSGSPTHNHDFELVVEVLGDFFTHWPGAQLRVVGDVDSRLLKRIGCSRVQRFKKVDYFALQRLIAEVELNLVPLVKSTFTDCKSELKYFEAAAVGVPSVASATDAYSRAITHGRNGFIVDTGDWRNVLEEAMALTYSTRNYAEMASEAHSDAVRNFSPVNMGPLILSSILKFKN